MDQQTSISGHDQRSCDLSSATLSICFAFIDLDLVRPYTASTSIWVVLQQKFRLLYMGPALETLPHLKTVSQKKMPGCSKGVWSSQSSPKSPNLR